MIIRPQNVTILVGDDDTKARGCISLALQSLGYAVEVVSDGDEVLDRLAEESSRFGAVLLDVSMPRHDGLEILKEIRRSDPEVPVIMLSVAPSSLSIVTAMKLGATDFLSKPVEIEELKRALDRSVGDRPERQASPAPRPVLSRSKPLIASSPRMRELVALMEEIGWSDTPVLIQGETGSGKEVFARELHSRSSRAGKCFLKLNCAALPQELVESELFGYERGAFTGAFQRKPGMFEIADGGTLLLDEIGDMDYRLQAKLLQVLQDQEFQRIGGKTVRVNVRLMAATHCNLEQAIAEKKFREDLYYRLNVINVHIPALRERAEDIMPLAGYFADKHSIPGRPAPVMTTDLRDAMTQYPWPGNVRELENFVRKAIILRDTRFLARELRERGVRRVFAAAGEPVSDLPAPEAADAAREPVLDQVSNAMRRAETEAIVNALDSTRWNRKEAAALLRIDYKALLYKMKKLGLDGKTVSQA